MQRYYFIVKILPEDSNLALLLGRCISILHGFICKNSISGLGISFPGWSDESIGNTIAFVHVDTDVLKKLQSQSYFQDMQNFGVFKIFDNQPVPGDCSEVIFKRNQAIAKMFVGDARRRLKRLEKRALQRGEVFNPVKNQSEREFDIFHCVALGSTSSKQEFLLHIQRERVTNHQNAEFNQYGLATNQRCRGSVPDLSKIHA